MKKKFNKRAFVSLVTFFLSIVVLITGVILLVMPDATLAYWNKWSFFSLEKNQWESFHAVASIYLTIIVVIHIMENWKAMISYMKSKSNEKFKLKKELLSAIVVSFILVTGSFTDSPISKIVNVFEPISESWYTSEYEPPFEDAQGLPLELLVKVQDLEKVKIETIFENKKIIFAFEESLEDIADNNDISSRKLYEMIK